MDILRLSAPSGWKISTIGESYSICNNLREPINATIRESIKGEYPYYGPTQAVDYLNHYRLDGKYALIGEDGDHFLKYASRSMTQLVTGKFNVNNHAHVVQGTEEAITEWFYHFFMHTDIFPFLTRQGAGRYKLNKAALEQMPILLPPPAEQSKIAAILSTWDEAIDLTEQLIAAKQKRKQALMQQLLTGKVRFPKFLNSKELRNSNFGLIPEDWNIVKLESVMEAVSRTVRVQPEKEYKLIGVRWYGEGAHIHNIVVGSDLQTLTLNHIWEGDILYNKMWTTKGAFAIAKKAHHNSYGTNEYPQFRAITNRLDLQYFEYVFRLPRFQNDATALCRGTTGRARLNPQDFLQLEIPLPSYDEQQLIAQTLSACDEELSLLQQKLDALRLQKKGLMQQLLTGKIRVNATPPQPSPNREGAVTP